MYMQRHIVTEIAKHSRSTALERSVKISLGGWGLKYYWEYCGWGLKTFVVLPSKQQVGAYMNI